MLPLLAYFVFGPSRILVLGPDSAVSPVVAAAIIPIAGGERCRADGGGGAAGAACRRDPRARRGARLGFVTDLISKPVRLGYLAGIAVTVFVTQLPKVLGIPARAESFVDEARAS